MAKGVPITPVGDKLQNQDTTETPQVEKSFIYIETDGPGSVVLKHWSINLISPMQMLAISKYLEDYALDIIRVDREKQRGGDEAQIEVADMPLQALEKKHSAFG